MVPSAFVTASPVLKARSSKSKTCARRAPRAQTGAPNPGPPNTGEWSDGTNLSPGLQKIEFIIRPNGIVEEHVMGIKGSDCVKLTEKIEQALGEVVDEKKTSEYFEQKVTVSDKINEKVSEGTSDGNWGTQW